MNCTECHHPIPAGLAVVRSVSFVQHAWHRECYAWQIPAQRVSADEKVTR
jgi:hypothetical protein